MNLRIFAPAIGATEFYSGSIGKIDFVTGFYQDNNIYRNFDRGLPNVIYLLDFTDPEPTQYFKNRITTSGYPDAIRGTNNHTDYADFAFNPINEFA